MHHNQDSNWIERLIHLVTGVLAPSLQVQFSLFLGFLVCLPVSYFYQMQNRIDLVPENPNLIWIGLGLSLTCYLLGNLLNQLFEIKHRISLRRGAWIVFCSWFIACSISAAVYFIAGFPDPYDVETYSISRRVVDSFYESVSGFSTAGTTILKSVEVYPKSLLLWRTLTQWIGAMGIAYLAITLFKKFSVSRSEIINSETETPNQLEFSSENEARFSGWRFLAIFSSFSLVAWGILYISGAYFRQIPYEYWYDNLFDSLNYAFSAVSTGGFAVYDSSVGLPINEFGNNVMGGLRNPTSEWILAIFMLLGGTNFILWFGLFFEGKFKNIFYNQELRAYLAFIAVATLAIYITLFRNNSYLTLGDDFRYAFFNVVTIISTTGLVNQDFSKWPTEAQGVLFSCYLIGGCVGSTAGGLKFSRFLVMLKYAWVQTKNLIFGKNQSYFTINKVTYSDRSAGLVLINMILYFLLFLFGSIVLLLSNGTITLTDGTVLKLSLETAFTATIANLGGIGPAAFSNIAGAGMIGSYYAFGEISKILMMGLMFIGRIGVLSILMLFITMRGQQRLYNSTALQDLDSDSALLTM